MEDILLKIAENTKIRVADKKKTVPLAGLKEQCAAKGTGAGDKFLEALRRPGLSFICEVKKASPSKGLISPKFPYLEIAKEYEASGADCISCLTEPKWFLGSDKIFAEIRKAVGTPMIRKDFTVDEYQIYEARLLGANAVLLICSLLGEEKLSKYLGICRELGLAALVEAHDEQQIDMAVRAGAEIIGVNNRNLRDFTVDIGNSGRLRSLVPEGIVFVAESGIRGAEDVRAMREAGADAVLVGEALMRSGNIGETLREFREAGSSL